MLNAHRAKGKTVQHDGFTLGDGQCTILIAQNVRFIEVGEGFQLVPILLVVVVPLGCQLPGVPICRQSCETY